jgi:hypothetical protein
MRRIVILLVVLVLFAASLSVLWIFRGREISSFVDRYWTIEIQSTPIHSVHYQGSGTGGTLILNDVSLSLNEVSPRLSLSIGSTKDNQLALASSGRVFALGPLSDTGAESADDRLAAPVPAGDQAVLSTRHSALSWPNALDFNFMTGHSPSWKRHIYYEIRWKKSAGADLRMLWRYEQLFYPGNGWANGFMTREGSTGLIRVEIKE